MLFQTGFPASNGFRTLHRTTIGIGKPKPPTSLMVVLLNEKSALLNAYFGSAASSGEQADAVWVQAGKDSTNCADKFSPLRRKQLTSRPTASIVQILGSIDVHLLCI